MNDLMLQLKRHGINMDIYTEHPVTNGFMVRFRKIVNGKMLNQDHIIDIEMLIGPYLSIDRILIEYLRDFIKVVEEKESV